ERARALLPEDSNGRPKFLLSPPMIPLLPGKEALNLVQERARFGAEEPFYRLAGPRELACGRIPVALCGRQESEPGVDMTELVRLLAASGEVFAQRSVGTGTLDLGHPVICIGQARAAFRGFGRVIGRLRQGERSLQQARSLHNVVA